LNENGFFPEMMQRIGQIDRLVTEFMPSEASYQKKLLEAMNYSIVAGGKRIRPLLMQEAFYLFKEEGVEIFYPFMAAFEMIHAYS
jgi:geranylgeranyl diphosphate synthase type II